MAASASLAMPVANVVVVRSHIQKLSLLLRKHVGITWNPASLISESLTKNPLVVRAAKASTPTMYLQFVWDGLPGEVHLGDLLQGLEDRRRVVLVEAALGAGASGRHGGRAR